MSSIDAAIIRGAVQIELRNVRTGAVDVWRGENMVVDGGLDHLLDCFIGTNGVAVMGHMALGSGTGTFVGTRTALFHEYHRKAITSASVSGAALVTKIYYTTAQASGVIRELGLTNAAASGAGALITHLEVSPSKTKGSTQEMVVTHTLTMSRA